jgi:glycosyltransferase involved in cell wall biosynthesis
MDVAVVIPALDEEESIGVVVRELLAALEGAEVAPGRRVRARVYVGDNGSSDGTARVARAAGATVVAAPRRGYGTACLAALAALPDEVDAVLFADGDASDDPDDAPALLEPIARDEADLVIGSRELGCRLGLVEDGALTRPQRFGNQLATTLLRLAWGVSFTDLGPYRAVSRRALDELAMDDPDFGWTVQMQARACALGLRSREVPVRYRRRRAGTSKVSGDLKGSVLAGTIILRTLFAEAVRSARGRAPAGEGRKQP